MHAAQPEESDAHEAAAKSTSWSWNLDGLFSWFGEEERINEEAAVKHVVQRMRAFQQMYLRKSSLYRLESRLYAVLQSNWGRTRLELQRTAVSIL